MASRTTSSKLSASKTSSRGKGGTLTGSRPKTGGIERRTEVHNCEFAAKLKLLEADNTMLRKEFKWDHVLQELCIEDASEITTLFGDTLRNAQRRIAELENGHADPSTLLVLESLEADVEDWKQRNEELVKKLAAGDKTRDKDALKLEDEITRLNQRIKKQESNLKDIYEEHDSQQAENGNLKSQVIKLQKELKMNNEELNDVYRTREEQISENLKLRESVNDMETELAGAEKRSDSILQLKGDIANLTEKLENTKETLVEKERLLKTLHVEKEALRKLLDRLNSKESHGSEMTADAEAKERLLLQVSDLQDKLHTAHDHLQSQSHKMELRDKEIKEQKEEYAKRHRGLQVEIQKLEHMKDTLSDDLKKKDAEITTLKTELSKTSS